MILIFLIAGLVSCLIVIACFLSQTDSHVSGISRRHTIYLYSFIIASWCIPQALLILCKVVIASEDSTVIAFRYWMATLQFVLLAGVYVRYRLAGVLALHVSAIVTYLLYEVICTMGSIVESDEMPAVTADDTLFLTLATVSGSLASALYALAYISIRRKRAGGAR